MRYYDRTTIYAAGVRCTRSGLAVVLECLALFTLGLVYPSGQVVPPWIPFLDVHPAKLRTTQQRLNNRPMPLRSGATPQEAYAAEINMQ